MSGFNSSSPGGAPAVSSLERSEQPLTLTVHSLPSPLDEGVRAAAATRAGRWKLVLLFLFSASPVIASYFTYYVIRPEARRNYGELIEPQRPLPPIVGVDPQGQSVPLTALAHQWLLISVADSSCDAQCERHLYLQRQLRESLGKDKARLDWVWLRTGERAFPERLRAALQPATVLWVDEAELQAWLQPAPGARLADHLYLVDPLGHWMMRYPVQADPAKVRRDLERLMRASASWDQPGRPQAQ
jgi:cytochrome oxidase Cu insertion factor (SCO1/SenC/PrrC family)